MSASRQSRVIARLRRTAKASVGTPRLTRLLLQSVMAGEECDVVIATADGIKDSVTCQGFALMR